MYSSGKKCITKREKEVLINLCNAFSAITTAASAEPKDIEIHLVAEEKYRCDADDMRSVTMPSTVGLAGYIYSIDDLNVLVSDNIISAFNPGLNIVPVTESMFACILAYRRAIQNNEGFISNKKE
jgi:hypothetical protein